MYCLKDPRVIHFYETHPEVDFHRVNEFIVDLFDRAGDRHGAEQRELLRTVQTAMASLAAEHAQRTEEALSRQLTTVMDRVGHLLKSDDAHAKLLPHLALLQTTIQRDVLARTPDLASFDAKLALLQEPVLAVLRSNQESLGHTISSLKEDHLAVKLQTDRMHASFEQFLQRQGVSQAKGAASETALEEQLTALFPTSALTRMSGFTGAGDFKLERNGTVIMFENKNYSGNVKNTEVQKFLRDATTQRCNAVLLSQTTGIVGKRDFEIEVDDGKVLVYLHRVQANPEKLTAAVAIIDALVARLQNFEASEHAEGTFLPKETLDAINAEFQTFLHKKLALTTSIKENCKRTLAQVDDLHLLELARILGGKYVSPAAKAFTCDHCARTFDSKRALSAHARACTPSNI